MSRLQTILDALDALNATYVLMDFAGSGDSGEIHSFIVQNQDRESVYPWGMPKSYKLNSDNKWVEVEGPELPPEPTVTIPVQRREWDPEEKTMKTIRESKLMSLASAIEAVGYDDISATGVDWYNNEGGCGQWKLWKGKDGLWRHHLSIDHNVHETYNVYDREVIIGAKLTPSKDISNIVEFIERASKRSEEEAL